MSYNGHLGFGLLGDYDALPELDAIADDLKWAIASLYRAAGLAPSGRPRQTQSRAPRSARRSAAAPRRLGAEARQRELTCAWRSARSTPPSATSRATQQKIADGLAARTRGRRRAGAVPRARADRLPARGPAAQGALPRRRARARSRSSPSRRRRHRRRRRLPRARRGRLQRRRGARGRARSTRSTGRCTCPTTASSTSSATSRPGPAAPSSSSSGTRSG